MERQKDSFEKPVKTSGQPASWTVGIIVVALGIILLLRNLGVDLFFLHFDNWWALVILIAAVVPLSHAVHRWRQEGFSYAVVGGILSSVILATVGLLFLLQLSFFTWWPLFVIYGGVFMLITNRR